MDGKVKLAVIVSILALVLFTGKDKKISMSGLSKRRARRLFYISGGKVIPRSQVDSAKRMTRQGYGKVYAVWAFNADEARDYIRQGKAETVSGLRGLTEKERKYIAERYPIRPAIRIEKKDIYIGNHGDLHSDINDYLPDGWWNLTTESGWVDQKGNWLTRGQAAKIVAEVEKTPIDKRSIWQGHSAYIRATAKENSLGETPQWKYEDYSNLSRQYAKLYTKPEIEKELHKLEREQEKNKESHLRAIQKSTSMQSNSQHRAQAGNVVVANYETRQALKNALELYEYYPEYTKGGASKPKQKMIPESRGQMTLFGIDTFKKGDKVQQKVFYHHKPLNIIGTVIKVWDTPEGQWGTVFFGVNQSGQRMQNKYPLSVFRNLSRAKRLPEQSSFTERSQMTLFGGLAESTNIYQDDFPFLQFKRQKNGKYKPFISGTKDIYEIHNIPVNKEFDSPKAGYRAMLYQIKPDIEATIKHNKTILKSRLPEQTSFTERSQMTLFGLGRIDNCYKYLIMKGFGPTEACFHGESTRGKGTATFTATDKTGRIIPSMNVTKIMTFDKFYDILERNKAKRVS